MTATTFSPSASRPVEAIPTPRSGRWIGSLADTWSMTRRNLVHISREPMQLSDVTIQPVLFTFLFVYIFGGAIPIPGGGSYKDYLLAGILALNLVTSTMGTAVGLTGLVVGWRADASIPSIIAGFLLVLLFAYSLTWIAACVGLNSKSPESAASFGFIVLFPLAFVSNAMVPTLHMPGWMQAIANWNPVSAVCAGARHLWGNPNPSSLVNAWPMQHPVEASLIWSVLILAIAGPLASYFFRQRITE